MCQIFPLMTNPFFLPFFISFRLIICQLFLHFLAFNCYTAYFLKLLLQLICSSIMDTQEARQPLMKVGQVNVCSLSYQFYYIMSLVNIVRIGTEESFCINILVSLLKVFRKISKLHFCGRVSMLIKNVRCFQGRWVTQTKTWQWWG